MARKRGDGHCLWCTHLKASHTGRVDPAILEDPKYARVKWTTSACHVPGCACRTYES